MSPFLFGADVLDRLAGNIAFEHDPQSVRRPFDGACLNSLDPFDLAHTRAPMELSLCFILLHN